MENESALEELHGVTVGAKSVKERIRKIVNQPKVVLPFLAIGRLVYIKTAEVDWGWGVYLNFM
jgi:ATP-dependent RNA helicase DOB1